MEIQKLQREDETLKVIQVKQQIQPQTKKQNSSNGKAHTISRAAGITKGMWDSVLQMARKIPMVRHLGRKKSTVRVL